MYLIRKVRNVSRGLLQAYGNGRVKRFLWNSEFKRGRWDCLDSTLGDCVYPYVQKYANHGSILDLGCGSGSTGNELDPASYRCYIGVDISDVAIEKARMRTEENGRTDKNTYFQSGIFSYVPTQQFNVILFRDSIYYIRRTTIPRMLDRYSKYLKEKGVFIVRMCSGAGKYKAILEIIESDFEIVGDRLTDQSATVVITFRQRQGPLR